MSLVVALLRGVNVGAKQVSMPQLRAALQAAGFDQVTTYLNSGNVLLDPGGTRDVGPAIERLISAETGLEVRVITRTSREMDTIARHHPFAGLGLDPRFLHVVFLDRAPEQGAAIDPDRSPQDRVEIAGREVYVAYGKGQGRSKLTLDHMERALGVTGTARNWNTVTKLAAMAGNG